MAGGRSIAVLGGSGQLGQALLRELSGGGRELLAPGRRELDLRFPEAAAAWLRNSGPSALIYAAAYSDVARAEVPSEREEVFRLNRDTPAALAAACSPLGVVLVFVSTDFVFDGRAARPYREDDPPAPLQVYGESKLEGERAVAGVAGGNTLIVRTSTLFGPGRRARPHYVDAVLAQARDRDRIRAVRNPVASPTLTSDLASAILNLLDRGARGLVHVVNAGSCSRLELARETIRLAGLASRVRVEERPESPARPLRPPYSVLDTDRFERWTGRPMRPWQEALAAFLQPEP